MDGGGWVGGWLGVRWILTVSFLYIVSIGFATLDVTAEGCKINNIWNGMLTVYILEGGIYIRENFIHRSPVTLPHFN